MASYQGINSVLAALETYFKERMPSELTQGSINASVKLLGSADVAKPISGNTLGLYLHRMSIDAHGRARHFAPTGANTAEAVPELPVNLHLFLIASASSAAIEADLMAWAMVELANFPQLDYARLHPGDTAWGERELVSISPEDMSTEDLMRIWEVFDSRYTMTVPYIARTVRLRLREPVSGDPVATRVYPVGVL